MRRLKRRRHCERERTIRAVADRYPVARATWRPPGYRATRRATRTAAGPPGKARSRRPRSWQRTRSPRSTTSRRRRRS